MLECNALNFTRRQPAFLAGAESGFTAVVLIL
jgi:hypothetical protein